MHTTIGTWLLRLITWDSLLPGLVWSVPYVIAALLPGNRGAIEAAAVILPIAALFFRYRVGRRHIASNFCGPLMRRFQVAALCFGIFVMVFFDTVMMLTHVMPKGAAVATINDLIVWMVLYSVYLAPMTFAMYPGSRWNGDPADAMAADYWPEQRPKDHF